MFKSHFQVFKKSHSFNYLPMVGYLDFTIIDSWCWEGLRAGGEGDDRGWDGWMASLTWWTWVWVDSGSWWWTGRPGVLQSMGLQRVGHKWATELNWNSRENPSVAFSNLLCHKTGSRQYLCLHLICLHSKSFLSASSTPEKAIWLHSRAGSL